MREIKFRARRKDTGEAIPDFMEDYRIYSLNIESFIVEQYTGLKDRNKKEIYDGDIVRATHPKNGFHQNFEIRFIEDMCRFMCWKGSNTSLLFPLNCDTVLDYNLEVIGNTYENSDLLKV